MTRCLFITSRDDDFLSACLFDGLQTVLGPENVLCAEHYSYLAPGCPTPAGRVAGAHALYVAERYQDVDVAVVNACYDRDHDGGWLLHELGNRRLWGRAAYVEGWDAAWHVHPPPDVPKPFVVFRKEWETLRLYPYVCGHLTFACPERWLAFPEGGRDVDVFFAGNLDSCDPRWPRLRHDMRKQADGLAYAHWGKYNVAVEGRRLSYDEHTALLRRTKLALVPAGADGAETMRGFEAAAAGAVPVFVSYPDLVREDWFTPDVAYFAQVEHLADILAGALRDDLAAKRARLREHVLAKQTTRRRAEKVLRALGVKK